MVVVTVGEETDMLVTQINNHFIERTAERVGLFLRSKTSVDHLLKAINTDYTRIRQEEGGKSVFLVNVDGRFYTLVVNEEQKMLVTVMFPNGADRTLAFKRFERTHSKDMSNDLVQQYIQWRGELAERQGWKTQPPKLKTNSGNPIGPKTILHWGAYVTTAQWNGSVWVNQEPDKEIGTEIDPFFVWGWMENDAFARFSRG
jgi:hypothetical protein